MHDDQIKGFARITRQQDDVASRGQALRFFTPTQIKYRLAVGAWRRLSRGVYLTRPGPLGVQGRQWHALLRAGADEDRFVCLGGVSALSVWGLKSVTAATMDIVVPANRTPRLPGYATLRRTTRLPAETRVVNPPATLPARSLIDAVEWARTEKEAKFLIAACFQQGLINLRELLAEDQPESKRHRLLLIVARDCEAGSHTLGELRLIAICRRLKLPLPQRQVRFVDDDGRVRYLDAVWDEFRLAVEVDGGHHDERAHRWDDYVKENAAALDGYRILRLANVDLDLHPQEVGERLRGAMLRRGWKP